MSGTVLISGGGVAGLASAYWLRRFGFTPTIVERAPQLRGGGQAIDIRGAALDVVAAMGLLDAARGLRTHIKGMSVVDADGKEIFRTEERTATGGRTDSGDIELFRDDLCRLLFEATTGGVEYLYGDSIAAIEENGEHVTVSFESGASRRFDCVVGADGVRSNVRGLAFGDEKPFLWPLGVGLALFTAPNTLGLKDWQVSFRDAESGFVIYPDRQNTALRVGVGFAALPGDDAKLDLAGQKALVAERCAIFRWEIPRLLEAMPGAPDFYYGALAQVRMDRWSRGRVVLAGDAGYCASPFSGQGTSLALVGGYVLSRELSRAPGDIHGAFFRYETKMRPYVEANQALVDPERQGPIPDDLLDVAKNAIILEDLPRRASMD
jgi:2-polyprenyl-6-methoxyphenol hydroxylase-like FAD-dependent oxidoreductase